MNNDLPGAEVAEPTADWIRDTRFRARAILLGQRLDLNRFEAREKLATHPLVVAVEGGGVAVLFRYGTVVMFAVPIAAQQALLSRLNPLVQGTARSCEIEDLEIVVDPAGRQGIDGERVSIHSSEVRQLQVLATALSKSVVLAEYELLVNEAFDRIEPLAFELHSRGRVGRDAKSLLRHIGQSLLSQHRMVGRAEVREKPDVLWEYPDLEPLYQRLADELEISERYAALECKLDLISDTASTLLEVLHTRQGHRLEWYIVILIVVEIVLLVYDMFLKG